MEGVPFVLSYRTSDIAKKNTDRTALLGSLSCLTEYISYMSY